MSKLAERCIASWKNYLPDYELRLWNEDNFDLDIEPYTREAYDAKKYAFVTDYVRLWALERYGGVYMDTDVEVLKNIDKFLSLPAFSGFESDVDIPTGIMASEKGGEWVREMLAYYKGRHFKKEDGSLDLTTNVVIIEHMMEQNGFVLKNSYQVYKDGIMHIFPKDYFCPKGRTGILSLTENSYCIHHFDGSWKSKKDRRMDWFYKKVLGPRVTTWLVKMKRRMTGKSMDNL